MVSPALRSLDSAWFASTPQNYAGDCSQGLDEEDDFVELTEEHLKAFKEEFIDGPSKVLAEISYNI